MEWRRRSRQLGAVGGSILDSVGWASHLSACVLPACLPARLPACLPAFRGRLFNQIRSREGLAYSVSGGWSSTPIDHPGLFIATAETAQPVALLAALRSALEGAVAEAPTQQELQRAKQVGGCSPRCGGVVPALSGPMQPYSEIHTLLSECPAFRICETLL